MFFTHSTVSSALLFETVKVMSFVLSRPIDCKIISTLILCFARTSKSLKATPGVFGIFVTEIRATYVSFVTPLMSIFSILVTSLTIVPGTRLRLERTSNSTLYFLAISTERLFKTCAPRVASSSISS